MSFENQQIHISDIPRVSDLTLQGLEKGYLNVMLIRLSIFSTILIIASVILYIFQPIDDVPSLAYVVSLVIAVLYIAWRYIVIINGYKNKAFALRDKDIVYKTGWLWKSVTTTPFCRVQHISIVQGPIERRWNLSRLKLYTAGGSTSDLSIPGLDHNMAQELKEFIAQKTRLSESEEE